MGYLTFLSRSPPIKSTGRQTEFFRERGHNHSIPKFYRRQAAVTEWVDLRPIFEVCVKETGYKGGGRLREPWGRQETAEK